MCLHLPPRVHVASVAPRGSGLVGGATPGSAVLRTAPPGITHGIAFPRQNRRAHVAEADGDSMCIVHNVHIVHRLQVAGSYGYLALPLAGTQLSMANRLPCAKCVCFVLQKSSGGGLFFRHAA
jgi:hypothetical protein